MPSATSMRQLARTRVLDTIRKLTLGFRSHGTSVLGCGRFAVRPHQAVRGPRAPRRSRVGGSTQPARGRPVLRVGDAPRLRGGAERGRPPSRSPAPLGGATSPRVPPLPVSPAPLAAGFLRAPPCRARIAYGVPGIMVSPELRQGQKVALDIRPPFVRLWLFLPRFYMT